MAEASIEAPSEGSAFEGSRTTPPGLRLYSSPAGQPRFRRATDVVLLATGLILLAILVAAYPPGPFERSMATFLSSAPGWLDPAWSFLYDLAAAWAIALAVSAVIARRPLTALHALASLLLAVGIALCSTRLALGHWPGVTDTLQSRSGTASFPAMRLAEAAAVILTIGPHLVRPLQTAGRRLLALSFVGALVGGVAVPSGTVAALLVAIVAASAVRLAFGTSAGRPGVAEVAGALAELDVDADEIRLADYQVAGVVTFLARDPQRHALRVEVHGRDAYDNQLLEKLWRTLWYQDAGPSLRLSRRQITEHEALVTLLARRGGVATYELVRAGTTAGDDAVLVLQGEPRALAAVPAEELDDGLLQNAWHALGLLHAAHVAHGRIDTETVALVGDELGFVDFGSATTTPTARQLMTDEAQLLATTAALVGSERALAAAVASRGADGVASLLPYLQLPALDRSLRLTTKGAGVDIDELRKQAAALVGTDEPELVALRRVTWGSVIQIALLLLAALAVLSFATGIDYDQLGSTLSDATWSWIALGVLVAQAPRVTQVVSTLGSVPAELPFGPVYAMQLATSYMNLALPSSAARLAINVRFFQRQGIAGATAITSGAIDSFTGTVVQSVLLGLLLIFSESSLSFELSGPSSDLLIVVWVLLGALVAVVAAVGLVPRLRGAVVGRVRRWWPDVRAALGTLRASNKLALLLLGNVGTEVLFAGALGLFTLGLGSHLPLTELLVINMSVSLFSSFIPVPGGIGVTELGLTVGLTAAGMTEEAALAAVLLYRIATFYLPPLWGFFALRWLQHNRYL